MLFILIFGLILMLNPIMLILAFIGFLILLSLLLVFITSTYFYSYLIFLLFMSGIVIVLMYICGVVLVEKLAVNLKISYSMIILGLLLLIETSLGGFNFNYIHVLNHLVNYWEFLNMLKFLNYSFNLFSLFFIIYLFLCLIIIYEIVKNCNGPLRVKI